MKLLILLASVLAFAAASSARGRIFHGLIVKGYGFPYEVGIEIKLDKDEIWCSGVLIGDTWVLTAAHCFEKSTTGHITVYIGGIYRKQSMNIFRISNDSVIIHEAWDANTVENDIALIRIPRVRYSNVVKPAKLPPISNNPETFENRVAFFPGWGRGGDSGYLSLELLWANFTIISNARCAEFYPGDEIWNQDICAFGNNKASACVGDSGGGLIELQSRYVVGIASTGPLRGCEQGLPFIFTRVSYYREWINDLTRI